MTPLYKSLSHIIQSLPALPAIRTAISENDKKYSLTNLPSSLDALLFAHIYIEEKRNTLLIFEEAKDAERAFDDLAWPYAQGAGPKLPHGRVGP